VTRFSALYIEKGEEAADVRWTDCEQSSPLRNTASMTIAHFIEIPSAGWGEPGAKQTLENKAARASFGSTVPCRLRKRQLGST
jgi:hypothetical protein